jgi:hypothetical protein
MFLEEMEQVVPWGKLCALVERHYPKPGNGRRPKELEQMLRIYFLQQWFNLADPAVEAALYDSPRLLRVPLESCHRRQCPLLAFRFHAGLTLSTLAVEREHLISVSLMLFCHECHTQLLRFGLFQDRDVGEWGYGNSNSSE